MIFAVLDIRRHVFFSLFVDFGVSWLSILQEKRAKKAHTKHDYWEIDSTSTYFIGF